MARSLDELRKEAVADRPVDFADITPYEIVLPDDGTHIPIRNPASIPGKELDSMGSSVAAQLRLLCESGRDYRKLWRHVGTWPREDLNWLIADIIGHYEEQEEGKGRPSTS